MKIIILFFLCTSIAATNPGHYTKKPTAKKAQNMRDELSACHIAWVQTTMYDGRPMIYHPSDPMNKIIQETKRRMGQLKAILEAHGELND